VRANWSKAKSRRFKRRVGAVCPGLLGLAFYVLTIGTPISQAQVIRGTVRDARTAEPVMLAYVGLLAPGRELVVAGLADRYGSFSLNAPAAGSYFLYVARMGYKSVIDGLFQVGEDGVFELQVGLTRAAVELEDLVVEAEEQRSKLELVGFMERAAIGRGTFLIGEQILAWTSLRPGRLWDLRLCGIPRFVSEGVAGNAHQRFTWMARSWHLAASDPKADLCVLMTL